MGSLSNIIEDIIRKSDIFGICITHEYVDSIVEEMLGNGASEGIAAIIGSMLSKYVEVTGTDTARTR